MNTKEELDSFEKNINRLSRMQNSFWWGYNLDNFLFYGYNISSILILVITCIGLIVLALVFEWFKMVQAKVRQSRLLITYEQLRAICPSESDTLLSNTHEPGTSQRPQPPIITRRDKVLHLLNDLALWLSQQCVGYFLMLSVMAYNGYMLVAIVIGTAIGYFLFGHALMKINLQNCRVMKSTFCMYDCGDPDKTALIRPNDDNETGNIESSPACHVSSSTTSTAVSETTNIVNT